MLALTPVHGCMIILNCILNFSQQTVRYSIPNLNWIKFSHQNLARMYCISVGKSGGRCPGKCPAQRFPEIAPPGGWHLHVVVVSKLANASPVIITLSSTPSHFVYIYFGEVDAAMLQLAES